MPTRRSWKLLFPLLLLGLVAAAATVALWPQPDEFKYKLGVLENLKPVHALRTPWPTVATYAVPGSLEDVHRRVASDLKKTHPHWHELPDPKERAGVRFLDKTHPTVVDVEGIYVGPPKGTPGVVVRLVSPLRRPSRVQTWTYQLSNWIQGTP